jgi:hypothetical protein
MLFQHIAGGITGSGDAPVALGAAVLFTDAPPKGGTQYPWVWLFKGDVYLFYNPERRAYSVEEVQLLILEYFDKDRRKWEQLKRMYRSDAVEEAAHHRERIPEDVRIAVWRRDGGKCARCGSREKLEYDHIVPVSKGGSNTARNIELLCESCNRKKSNNIA